MEKSEKVIVSVSSADGEIASFNGEIENIHEDGTFDVVALRPDGWIAMRRLEAVVAAEPIVAEVKEPEAVEENVWIPPVEEAAEKS